MTKSEVLKKKILDSGMTIVFIAKKLGMTRESFYNKLNNQTDFKASEIAILTDLLRLTKPERDYIFLTLDVI